MWQLSLYLFLAIPNGAFGSQSSQLPSSPYTDGLPQPLPSAVLISTLATESRSQNQIKETTAAPTPGVLQPSLLNRSYSSGPPPVEDPTDTVLPSTVTAQSLSVLSSTANLSLPPLPTSTSVPTIPPTIPYPMVHMADCYFESSYSCETTYPVGCRCDELCKQFGDCCSDAKYVHNTNIPNFDCVSDIVLNDRNDTEDEQQYYWMIASCPKSTSDSELMNGIADLCEAQSLSSPPISDNRTGLVYRNKYCAQCHGVPEKEHVAWLSTWQCSDNLADTFNSSSGKVDIDVLLASCYASVFIEPQWLVETARLYPLRECDSSIIYKCQPAPETNTSSERYRILEEQCQKEPGKAKALSTVPGVYKNEYCALCSSPTMDESDLQCPPPINRGLQPPGAPPFDSFTFLLDVTGSGAAVIGTFNIQIISIIEQSCAEGQVFDVYSNVCRESLCQPGYTYNGTFCLPIDSNCTLIALNTTEYQIIDSQIIFWIALEKNVTIQGYNSEGNPLVCTNFSSNFTTTENKTVSRTLYGYPAAFSYLSYLGLSVDVVAASILLFSYVAFAEMRTFYGKLFMNFVLVLLLGDLTFLLGPAAYTVSLEDVVCQLVAILLHYLFLARFVWMSLLSLNVARHFYHAMKFIVSEEKESWHYLILYMAAGWLSPLLVLLVTVPVNYAIPGSVGYGVDGLCWMDQTLAIILTFIAPLAICILFTSGAFTFVCILLVKWQCANTKVDLKRRASSRNCRVLVAVFCITGATWVFGFLAQIDSTLSWAWYPFIILSSTQAVFLTLAYVCTAKVLRLYRIELTKGVRFCGKMCRYKSSTSEQITQVQLEAIKPSMEGSTTQTFLASTQASIGQNTENPNDSS